MQGGIVGLATAWQLANSSPDTSICILEKEQAVAEHQTGHNSGVLHSGIYYKPGSLKAINCREGKLAMEQFCAEHRVDYELCGKIIVATDQNELPALENVYQRGIENGLTGLKKIGKEQIKEYEPHCSGIEGIFVPQTGIINYTEVSVKYGEKFKEKGGEILFNHKITDIKTDGNFVSVITEKETFTSKLFINCGGLYSDKIAEACKLNLGQIDTQTFSDGEINVVFDESIRGEIVVLVAQAQLPYHNLFELFIAIDAARRASAKEIICVIPYLPHSRQERKDDTRSAISSRLIADFLSHQLKR